MLAPKGHGRRAGRRLCRRVGVHVVNLRLRRLMHGVVLRLHGHKRHLHAVNNNADRSLRLARLLGLMMVVMMVEVVVVVVVVVHDVRLVGLRRKSVRRCPLRVGIGQLRCCVMLHRGMLLGLPGCGLRLMVQGAPDSGVAVRRRGIQSSRVVVMMIVRGESWRRRGRCARWCERRVRLGRWRWAVRGLLDSVRAPHGK